MRKFPPRGYRQDEYPLPHDTQYSFTLDGESETQNSTITTLFKMTELAATPELIEVNPTNLLFAEDGGTSVHRGSIIPKISLHMHAALTKGAIETDKIRQMNLYWIPLYTSFEDSLLASDERTGITIESIIELQRNTTNKVVTPLFSTVNLSSGGSQFLSTVPHTEVFGDMDLAGDAVLESVAFDLDTFMDARQFFSNAGMLKKVAPKVNKIVLTQDRYWEYHSNNFTYPTVKRANPFTFCGILWHLPLASRFQYMSAGDTTDIPHVQVNMSVRYDEWNNAFEQAPL